MNKNRKERGLKYVRKDGTVVPARQVKPPCGCRMKCYEKYSEPIRQKLLTNLLRLKSDSQNQFLANHITVQYTSRPQVNKICLSAILHQGNIHINIYQHININIFLQFYSQTIRLTTNKQT